MFGHGQGAPRRFSPVRIVALSILASSVLAASAPTEARADWKAKFAALKAKFWKRGRTSPAPTKTLAPQVAKPTRVSLGTMGTMGELTAAVQAGKVGRGKAAQALINTLTGVDNFSMDAHDGRGNPFTQLEDTRAIANILGKGVEKIEVKTKLSNAFRLSHRNIQDWRGAVDVVSITVTHPDGSKSGIDAYKSSDNPYGFGPLDLRKPFVVVSSSRRGGKRISRTLFIEGQPQYTDRGKHEKFWQQRADFLDL